MRPRKSLLAVGAVLALGTLGAAVLAIEAPKSAPQERERTAPPPPQLAPRPQLPALRGNSGPDPSAPPTTPTPYSAWAGPGCASGTYREEGRFENGDAAWYTVHHGGHQGDTCDGSFSAVPMSGRPDHDGDSSATWSWRLGPGYRTCALAVYVPDSGRDQDTAGHPTVYTVLPHPDEPGAAYAAFGVRQTAHRGTLVRVGSYRVKGDSFTVRLLDRGRDWGAPPLVGAHHAAAQLKITCT